MIINRKTNFDNIIDNISHTFLKEKENGEVGLFARDKILKDTIIGYFDGQVVLKKIFDTQQFEGEYNYLDAERLWVRPYKTKYSFISRIGIPNLEIKFLPLRLITKRTIDKNEELVLGEEQKGTKLC